MLPSWEIVITLIHHYVTATKYRNSCLKETFLAEELANFDILTQQKILCVEGNPWPWIESEQYYQPLGVIAV